MGGRLPSVVALAALLLALLGPWASVRADEGPGGGEAEVGPLSYYRDVRPILQSHCQGCHQPARPDGRYVMTDFDRLLDGGESGLPAVVPGEPDASYLIDQVTPLAGRAAMPKDRPPLSDAELDRLVQWIAEGARDDTPESARPRYDADNPPRYAAPPVITSLDYQPGGDLLAVSGYHEVVLHHSDGSGVARRLVGMSERIESARFSPDGRRLAVTGGSPGRMGEVQVWDVDTGQLLLAQTVGFDTCYGASWSPDGRLIAFGCPDNTIRAIDAATGQQVLFNGAHEDWVLDTAFSLDGQYVVSVSRDMSMKLTNLPTQRFIDNVTSITPGALKGGLHVVARHPSEEQVVTGGADGSPRIYRIHREQARQIGDDYNLIRAFAPMPGRVFDAAFSADGARIVVGSSLNATGEVRVYAVDEAQARVKIELPSGVFAVAFDPGGGTVAAGGFDGYVRLIDAASGEVVRQFFPVELEDDSVASAH